MRHDTPYFPRISSLVLFTLSRSARVTDAPTFALAQSRLQDSARAQKTHRHGSGARCDAAGRLGAAGSRGSCEKSGCGDRIAELGLKLMLNRKENMEFPGQRYTLIKLTQQERRSESINEQTVDVSLPLKLDPQEQVQQRTVKRIAVAENKAVKDARVAYDADTETARKDLVLIHPIRLGLILNFSVSQLEVIQNPDVACKMARVASEHPFAKVKGLITCLINRLQAGVPSEASHTSYRDEGTSKATGKKLDFEADDAKHSSKLEASVDGEVSTLQLELGAVSERQLQTDTTRADERDQDCEVLIHVNRQSPSIAGGVHVGDTGDQGMFKYASNETEDAVSLTHQMATRMRQKSSDVCNNGDPWWFFAHGKTQVMIEHVEGTDESLDPRKIHTVVTHATAAATPEQETQHSTQGVQQTVGGSTSTATK